MSNILMLKKNSNFYLNGELLLTEDVEDMNVYMMQLLGFFTTLESGINVEQLVHSVYGMKEFIKGYFSEDYEIVRAFALSTKLDKKYKCIRIYKSFTVEYDDFSSEDEFLFVTPEIEFIEATEEEKGYNKFGEIPVIIDEGMILTHNENTLKLKTKFTLLDILTCVFDEMSHNIKSGSVIAIQ